MYNYTAPGLALRTHLSDTRHCTAQLPSLQRQHKYNYNARKYRYNTNTNTMQGNTDTMQGNTNTMQGNTNTMQGNTDTMQRNSSTIQERKWLRLGLVKKVALDLTYFLLE